MATRKDSDSVSHPRPPPSRDEVLIRQGEQEQWLRLKEQEVNAHVCENYGHECKALTQAWYCYNELYDDYLKLRQLLHNLTTPPIKKNVRSNRKY